MTTEETRKLMIGIVRADDGIFQAEMGTVQRLKSLPPGELAIAELARDWLERHPAPVGLKLLNLAKLGHRPFEDASQYFTDKNTAILACQEDYAHETNQSLQP